MTKMFVMKRFLGDEYDKYNSIIDKYNLEQNSYINLTACTSYPFQEVLEVQSMPLSTIPTEGVRGNRYFPNVESIDEIEDYAEQLALDLFNIPDASYKVNIQPNSGTQANQIIYNAILSDGDTVLSLNPKDGGHISHTKLGSRNINVAYYSLDDDLNLDYSNLEKEIISLSPNLIIVGASSYIKEFNYKKIHSITSKYGIPLMADICHSVLYIMGNCHSTIFPYVDFATFTMDKLLRGPQGGVIVYKSKYDKQVNLSTFPKTQGGPNQCGMFAKTMCFLRLHSMDINAYAQNVVNNTKILINGFQENGIETINKGIAHNHIVLIDVSLYGKTGREAEGSLFKNNILVNRNQIPNDKKNALTTSGIRIGTVPITNLEYSENDILCLSQYLSSIIIGTIPKTDILYYLLKKYHKGINISS